ARVGDRSGDAPVDRLGQGGGRGAHDRDEGQAKAQEETAPEDVGLGARNRCHARPLSRVRVGRAGMGRRVEKSKRADGTWTSLDLVAADATTPTFCASRAFTGLLRDGHILHAPLPRASCAASLTLWKRDPNL